MLCCVVLQSINNNLPCAVPIGTRCDCEWVEIVRQRQRQRQRQKQPSQFTGGKVAGAYLWDSKMAERDGEAAKYNTVVDG